MVPWGKCHILFNNYMKIKASRNIISTQIKAAYKFYQLDVVCITVLTKASGNSTLPAEMFGGSDFWV